MSCPRAAAITAATVVLTSVAAGQQLIDATTTSFPSPAPNEFTNQATIGDLDNDGDLDIIFANGGNFSTPGVPQTQRVYINDGAAIFTDESAARLDFTGLCRGVELGDIDRDGDLDVIFAQDFQRRPALFLNDGSGFFTDVTEARLPDVTLSSSRAQFGDIDNDGDLDLYLVNGGTNRFGCGQYQVYVNDGNGFFTDETMERHPLEDVCMNMDCIFGDIDNDFDLDVRTASTGVNNSRLYRNDGTGVFSTVTGVPPDSSCYSYDFGDMDGDGDLDLVGANGGSGVRENLLENDGTGVFTDVSERISPNPVLDDNDSKFLDYDNDGDLDLIIARLGSGGERVYENDGSGMFTQVSDIIEVVSDSSLDIEVADLNGDGALDVVTAQGESGSFVNRIYISSGPADTIAPRIVQTEQVDDTTSGPYVVRALILDGMSSDRNFFDGGIDLTYTVGKSAPAEVEMRHSGGQVYRGEIPTQADGSVVEYIVTARDYAGNEASGEARTFTVGGGLPGDTDGDGDVDFTDLVFVLSTWGPCPKPPAECPADFDDSGSVGFADLLAVLSGWTA